MSEALFGVAQLKQKILSLLLLLKEVLGHVNLFFIQYPLLNINMYSIFSLFLTMLSIWKFGDEE